MIPNIGDTVQVVGVSSGHKGMVGTVREIYTKHWSDSQGKVTALVGVDFGAGFDGHNLTGNIQTPTGWYETAHSLQILTKALVSTCKFEHVHRVWGLLKDKKLLNKNYPLPTRSTKASAGYDFVIPVNDPDLEYVWVDGITEYLSTQCIAIKPGKTVSIKTGVKFRCPDNKYLNIVPRNSLGNKHNVRLRNTIGVIDADYYSNPKNDGEIGICLYNFGTDTALLPVLTGVAQGIIQEYFVTEDDSCFTERKGASFYAE